MSEIIIGHKKVGEAHKPFIIAEMSANHNQSLERALQIIDEAAKAGVDAVKLQTFTPDTMTLDLQTNEFVISDKESLWHGSSFYHLYKTAHTPWEWHPTLFERCKKHGLIAFSTPFDETSVEFLETLNVPCYKISSFENTDLPLIRKVAATGKPVIISTGMASISELDETVKAAREAGCRDLILLKCTSAYPGPETESNLLTIPHIRHLFNCPVGLSDHTLGIGVAVGSVALSACVIEKHFTLARKDGGLDSAFSLEPAEMQSLAIETERVHKALGVIHYGATEREKSSLKYRRSLYITHDLKQGDVLSKNNLRAIRPGLGLPPKFIDHFLGKAIRVDVEKGTPLSWDLI